MSFGKRIGIIGGAFAQPVSILVLMDVVREAARYGRPAAESGPVSILVLMDVVREVVPPAERLIFRWLTKIFPIQI